MNDRPDDMMRDQPQRTRVVYERAVSAPLLRQLAVSIRREVEGLKHEYRRALVASDEAEAFVEALGELLDRAAQAPLTVIAEAQRRRGRDDDG